MIYAVCVGKLRDNSNAISQYKLRDFYCQESIFDPVTLKEYISKGKLCVCNLTLTSDNKLVEKKVESLAEIPNSFGKVQHLQNINNSVNNNHSSHCNMPNERNTQNKKMDTDNAYKQGEFLYYVDNQNNLKAKHIPSNTEDIITNKDYLSLVERDLSIRKRGKDIELFLRFITYKRIYDQTKSGHTCLIEEHPSTITTSKKVMLNNYMFWSNKQLINYKEDIDAVLEAISCIANFDISAFGGKSRSSDEISVKVHELFAEALVLAVIENNYAINTSQESFVAEKLKLCLNSIFGTFFSSFHWLLAV